MTEAKAKRTETKYTTVKMDDGRVVDFPGNRKLQKNAVIEADGTVKLTLDFVNGETRTVVLEPTYTLYSNFTAHGAAQKFGDEISGLDDIDDCVLAVDKLHERIQAGDWGQERNAGNSLAGTSILARAMIEVSGKTKEATNAYLSGLSQAQKIAMRNNPKLLPVIQRLEAEAAAKKKPKVGVDTTALLAGFLGAEEA